MCPCLRKNAIVFGAAPAEMDIPCIEMDTSRHLHPEKAAENPKNHTGCTPARAIQRQVLAAAGRVKWLLVLVLLIGGDWAADDSGRPASASLDQLGKDSDCDAGPKVQRHEAGAERAMRRPRKGLSARCGWLPGAGGGDIF